MAILISREEKQELLELSRSLRLKKDLQIIKKNCYMPFIKEGKIDLDKYIKFLTLCNAFINHNLKPFRKIEGDDFKI